MNRSRRNKPSSPPGQQGRPSRLRRSYRPSQQTQAAVSEIIESPKSRKSDFKSPTQVPRSRATGGEESPHNDSDFQQDIIWDATSPSPNRAGKRGHKQQGGLVDISEIVNRIAPKDGRPLVVEPTLQRWIGDSAAIPCTPEVQAPKTKKKSPRPNGVDDLLKLARQFDLNLIHQSEGSKNEQFSQDIFAPEDADGQTDELDFLFDGPTQRLSVGTLTQPLTEPAEPEPSSGPVASIAFEDDWDEDDFLNDSLVMEMTQNPLQQNLTHPRFCSTQKPLGLAEGVRGGIYPPTRTSGSDSNGSVKEDWEKAQRNWFSPVPVGSRRIQREPRLSHQTSPLRASSSSKTFQKSPSFNQKSVDLLDDDELLAAVLSQPVSSEPVGSQLGWDDLVDDHLLCEVCEDLENQIVAAEQRVVLGKTRRTPSVSTGSSLASRPVESLASVTTGLGSLAAGGASLTSSVQRGPFTFKKPSNPISMATSQASVATAKCSAAEIELKKQQAIERRRQRLQAAANVATAAT